MRRFEVRRVPTGRRFGVPVALVILLVAAGCEVGPADEPGPELEEDEEAVPSNGPNDAELGLPTEAFGPACGGLLTDLDHEELGREPDEDPTDVLADVSMSAAIGALPLLRHFAGALQAPMVDEEAWPGDAAAVTVFAPVSEAFRDRPVDERWDDGEAARILEGHVERGGAHLIQDLLHTGTIVTQAGVELDFDDEGETVTVRADGRDAEVVCANLAVDNGVIHVVDDLLTVDADPVDEDVMTREHGWLPPDEGDPDAP